MKKLMRIFAGFVACVSLGSGLVAVVASPASADDKTEEAEKKVDKTLKIGVIAPL